MSPYRPHDQSSQAGIFKWGASLLGLLLLLLTSTPVSAEGTLPLVKLESGGVASSWWVDQGKLDPVLRRVVDALVARQIEMVDPDGVESHPKISRIFRVPTISRANALNLAGLYSASRALIGSIVEEKLDALELSGLHRARITARLELVDVGSGERLFELEIAREGQGASMVEAAKRARSAFVDDLASLVEIQWDAVSAGVGVERTEPWLVFVGLKDNRGVDALARALASTEGVGSAKLAWTARGLVAFDINPERDDDAESIGAIAASLAKSPPDGTTLTLSRGQTSSVTLFVKAATPPIPE